MSAESASPPVTSPRATRWRKRLLRAVIALVILDQLLFWTLVTRPAGSIARLIVLTGAEEPPYFEVGRGLSTTYESWGKGDVTAIHTSSLGLRDRERPAEKPKGIRRVVAAGDSITFGIGVADDEAYPRQMERQLAERGVSDVEVWNGGVPGHAMADHLGFLRRKLLPLGPDVVILQLSRNDSAVPMPLSPWFLELIRFSGVARAFMIYRFNFVEDEALYRASLRAYIDECRRAGARVIVAYDGLPGADRAEALRFFEEEGIVAVEIGGEAFPKLPDDPHLDPEGNRRVAARLLPEVLTALERPGR